jgi:hypothetical protein
MGPGCAIAAALLAAGVTTVGGRTLQGVKRFRNRNGAKRRDPKRKLKETPG